MKRVILGFICSALLMPAIGYLFGGIYGEFWFFIILYFTVISTVFLGAPLFYFNRHHVNLKTCLLYGALIGLIASILFIGTGTNYFIYLALFIISGLISSVTFWIVGIRNNTLLGETNG